MAGVTLGVITIGFFLPPIPQPQAYHNFADQRTILGIPHCLDVISNAGFLVVGALGLVFLFCQTRSQDRSQFVNPVERWPYAVFFLGVAATSLGSAYYHLAPTNDRLMWDRLPMTLAFMSIVAAAFAERVSVRTGLRMLLPLVAVGASSVVYWQWSENQGAGDLRPYIFVQLYPMLAVPLLVLLFPPRYTHTSDLLAAFGFYAAAKIFELLDNPIFALTGIVSGHTLKHLAAAVCAYWILRMLRHRVPVAEKL